MLVNFSQSHPKLGEPGLSVEAGSRFTVAVGRYRVLRSVQFLATPQ